MKPLISLYFCVLSILSFGQENESAISFINATQSDDLIVLCKIISHPGYDSTKGLCPRKMVVEVVEILKGNDSSKLITIEGYDEEHYNDLACLYFYQIETYHVLGLANLKLKAMGNHSLEYSNGIVKGNISNEPSQEYSKKFGKVFEKPQEAQLAKKRDEAKIKSLRAEFERLSDMLNQTMDYKTFKKNLLSSAQK